MGTLLQTTRVACGAGGLATLFQGVSLTYGSDQHALLTYVLWYGVGVVLLVVAGALSVAIHRRAAAADQGELVTSDDSITQRSGRDSIASRGGRDAYSAGRDINIHTPETGGAGRTFDQAIGDAETELDAILGRLTDAGVDGWFPLDFCLPADKRQAAVDALEDRGLITARRHIDKAYNACDRLNSRLDGRFWSNTPIPEPAPAEILADDRIEWTVDCVENAIGALRDIRRKSSSVVKSQREAKRLARRVYSELDANRHRVDIAVRTGRFWNVEVEELQRQEWNVADDLIAEEAPTVWNAVHRAYVLSDAMNGMANDHYRRGVRVYDAPVPEELKRLRIGMREAMKALDSYRSGDSP